VKVSVVSKTGQEAVVANAIFDATGARLFEMPMTAGRVKEAVVAVSALGRRSLDRSRRES